MVQQVRPASQGPRVARGKLAKHNVIIEVPGSQAARDAIEQLGRLGLEADKVSITGPGVADGLERRAQAREADANLLTYHAVRVIAAGAFGLLVGALIGLLGALVLPFETNAENIFVMVVGVAILVGILFGLTAAMFFLSPALPWESTFSTVGSGAMYVGFHSEDTADADRAEKAFRDSGNYNVRRIDR
jgi:hypothetical protein